MVSPEIDRSVNIEGEREIDKRRLYKARYFLFLTFKKHINGRRHRSSKR